VPCSTFRHRQTCASGGADASTLQDRVLAAGRTWGGTPQRRGLVRPGRDPQITALSVTKSLLVTDIGCNLWNYMRVTLVTTPETLPECPISWCAEPSRPPVDGELTAGGRCAAVAEIVPAPTCPSPQQAGEHSVCFGDLSGFSGHLTRSAAYRHLRPHGTTRRPACEKVQLPLSRAVGRRGSVLGLRRAAQGPRRCPCCGSRRRSGAPRLWPRQGRHHAAGAPGTHHAASGHCQHFPGRVRLRTVLR
jgi:hypothetical protein